MISKHYVFPLYRGLMRKFTNQSYCSFISMDETILWAQGSTAVAFTSSCFLILYFDEGKSSN